MERIIKPKVFLGLSGGVDSSVSAALLKRGGYDVTGVFIKVWQPDFIELARMPSSAGGCTWKDDRLDAMRVCAKLEIPFRELNLEKEYKKEVVDYMIREYKAGKTPNPDVMCNRFIKFGGFYDWAMANGADFVATGHYARSALVKSRKSKVIKSENQIRYGLDRPYGLYKLFVGIDPQKDQSYFLWTLTQKELARTLFPVGGLEKPAVRRIAKKFGLPNADKKDSQGLCFIGKVDMKDFLSRFIKPKAGAVLDENGGVIGMHSGAFFFTIGQRRGFTVTKKDAADRPYFVAAKNAADNTITVSHKSPKGSFFGARREIQIERTNWISGTAPHFSKKYSVRVRYRQPLAEARIRNFGLKIGKEKGNAKENPKLSIEFYEPQIAAPGQSAVIYDGEACLGGGIIV